MGGLGRGPTTHRRAEGFGTLVPQPLSCESAKTSLALARVPARSGRASEILTIHAYRTIPSGVKSQAKWKFHNLTASDHNAC